MKVESYCYRLRARKVLAVVVIGIAASLCSQLLPVSE